MEGKKIYEKKPRLRRGTKLRIEAPLAKRRKDTDNVFINESFQVPIVRNKSEGLKPIINDKTGILEYRQFGYNDEYTPFTKVFLSPAAKEKVLKLGLRANQMYTYIMHNLKSGQQKIKLDKKKYCDFYDMKATTFSNTRMELMEANIIMDVKRDEDKDMYWINPFYLYNGSRIKEFEPFFKIEYSYIHDDYAKELEEIKKK